MPTAKQLYKQELDHCRDHFERVDLLKERGYLMKFTTFSATVENFLPTISRQKHATMFRELLLQQIFTSFDQKCLTAGDLVKLRGASQLLKKSDTPKIYCTYHLGSYRLLTSVLFRQGIDCVLLVGSNMNRTQGDGMAEHIEGLRKKHGLTNVFRVVEAGSPSAGLTVLRELKAGRSLIVFVDGSAETAPEAGEETQFLSVRLGNRRVLTRKGVGYLSHATGIPIVPVVSYREPDMTNILHCLKPIRPIVRSDREIYCQEAMQQLYDEFWPFLIRYPEQWEGWNYIHSFLEPQTHTDSSARKDVLRPAFNEARYSLCDLQQAPILFDRQLYQTYEITEDLRDLLLNINTVESVEDIVGQEVFGELIDMEVLH
ncbi:lysophospholipid acyltransferase family protein [Spirosoma flavum]|uniref:Lysophospholipid acyltransferase family protein n=1 Tax=Spirosoma flavum TaxID=2048557 RepID=A0ABW6AN96_9BACT